MTYQHITGGAAACPWSASGLLSACREGLKTKRGHSLPISSIREYVWLLASLGKDKLRPESMGALRTLSGARERMLSRGSEWQRRESYVHAPGVLEGARKARAMRPSANPQVKCLNPGEMLA